jgi:hypothetical protein
MEKQDHLYQTLKKLEKAAEEGDLKEAMAVNRKEFIPEYAEHFGIGHTKDNDEARLYDLARNNLLYSIEEGGMFDPKGRKERLKDAKKYIKEIEDL